VEVVQVRIRIDLSEEATKRLIRLAAKERRPVPLQAEVILLERLGLWPPEEDREEEARRHHLGLEATGPDREGGDRCDVRT
jgi:hypothetical protein